MTNDEMIEAADAICHILDGLNGQEVFRLMCLVMGRVFEQSGHNAEGITETMGKIAYAAIEYQRLMGGRDVH